MSLFNVPFGCTIHSHLSPWSRSEPMTEKQAEALRGLCRASRLGEKEWKAACDAICQEMGFRPVERGTKAEGMALISFWKGATPEQKHAAVASGRKLLEAA